VKINLARHLQQFPYKRGKRKTLFRCKYYRVCCKETAFVAAATRIQFTLHQ